MRTCWRTGKQSTRLTICSIPLMYRKAFIHSNSTQFHEFYDWIRFEREKKLSRRARITRGKPGQFLNCKMVYSIMMSWEDLKFATSNCISPYTWQNLKFVVLLTLSNSGPLVEWERNTRNKERRPNSLFTEILPH